MLSSSSSRWSKLGESDLIYKKMMREKSKEREREIKIKKVYKQIPFFSRWSNKNKRNVKKLNKICPHFHSLHLFIFDLTFRFFFKIKPTVNELEKKLKMLFTKKERKFNFPRKRTFFQIFFFIHIFSRYLIKMK